MPEELGCTTLELGHRRILAPLLVADLGVDHRLAHSRRRARHRVRAKVDHEPESNDPLGMDPLEPQRELRRRKGRDAVLAQAER